MRVKHHADLELGERMLYLRKEVLGFDRQQDFADRLGVTRGAVGNWELGKGVKRTTILQISETFNVSLVWLMAGTGAPVAKPGIDPQLELLPQEEHEALYEHFQAMIDNRRRHVEAKMSEDDT